MEKTFRSWLSGGTSYIAKAWSVISSPLRPKNHRAQSPNDKKYDKLNSNDAIANQESTGSWDQTVSVSSTSTPNVRFFNFVFAWIFCRPKIPFSQKVKPFFSSENAIEGSAIKLSSLDLLSTSEDAGSRTAICPFSLRALSVLGRGGHGKVILMKEKSTGTLVAVKEVAKANLLETRKKKNVRPTSSKIDRAELESLIMGISSDHPFMPALYGSFQNRDKIFLVMEYGSGGELYSLMQRQGTFSVDATRLYVAEIASALIFLHKNAIVYRDLKPENILLDREGHIILADFGLAVAFNQTGDDSKMRCISICGTPEYVSPELVLGASTRRHDPKWSYGKTVDWWALGVLTYEMLYKFPPFFDRKRKVMLGKILQCKFSFPDTKEKNIPLRLAANNFISELLQYNEHDRLGFGNNGSAEVKSHQIFAGLDWNQLDARGYTPEHIPRLKSDTDTSCFDPIFTKEYLCLDKVKECVEEIELLGYDTVPPEFTESIWYGTY